MRWLSKIAKRKHVAVADVIYEAIESFLTKWEAEAETRNKNHQISDVAKKVVVNGLRILVNKPRQLFIGVRKTAFCLDGVLSRRNKCNKLRGRGQDSRGLTLAR